MTMTINYHRFQFEKFVRILLLTAILTVGALNVSRCQNSDGYDTSEGRYDHLDLGK